MANRLLKQLATFFGTGYSPFAPGTAGTLAAIPLALLTMSVGPIFHMVFCILLLPLAVLAAQVVENEKAGHDHSEIVIDEVVGFLITMTWLPITWQSFAFGFLLFRLLDIFKPFPIGYLDRKVPGGLGVVIDDVVAGIAANVILQIVFTKTSWLGATSAVGF